MRAVFLALLSANLLFLAWARWIDSPRDAPAQDSRSRLPRLQLVTDSQPGRKPTALESPSADPLPAITQKTALQISDRSGAEGIPRSADGATRGDHSGAEGIPRSADGATRGDRTCTSVGPFNDIASAARAAGLLTQRGFSLQQRAEEGETIEGYWVFVGGMQSDDEVDRVVQRLDKSGFTDAHVMRNYSTNRRVSVGMFSSRDRAEKRAAAVRNMGLQPEIGERKFPGTVYWVDVTLQRGPHFKQLPPEYSFADIGHSKVEMQPCPVGVRPIEPETPGTTPGDDGEGAPWHLPRTTVASAPQRH